MSTRATYQFKNACIYIHHDGYLQGAAFYLYNAFIAAGRQTLTLTAEDMIRGNEKASITGGHDYHGDTEYRYTITGPHLSVEQEQEREGRYKWVMVWCGDWVEFINENLPHDWVTRATHGRNAERLVRCDIGWQKGLAMCESSLIEYAKERQALYDKWIAPGGAYQGNPNAANMQSITDELAAVNAALKQLIEGYRTQP